MADKRTGKQNPSTPMGDSIATWARSISEYRAAHRPSAELEIVYEELNVAEEELRAQNEELTATSVVIESERAVYKQLFDAAPLPYVVTNADGTVEAVNEAAAAMFGMRRDHLLGKPLAVFIGAEERPAFRQALFQLRGSGDPSRTTRLTFTSRGGAARPMTCIIGIARDRQRHVSELRWLLIDETVALREERDRMIEAALEARRAAERSDLATTQLLATVSHELRTPLAAISGYSELLETGLRGPMTPAQLEDLGRMRRAYQHMSGLLDDLLLYFRLGADGLRADVTRVPVADLVTGIASFVAPQANERQIAVEMPRVPDDLLVSADVDRARQILINLLANAVKFSPADATVTVTVELGDADARITVSDRGPGIPPEFRETMFEPFTQAKIGKGGRGGFGLGLAISRRLATLMDGELSVAPCPDGQGSAFTLRLRRA